MAVLVGFNLWKEKFSAMHLVAFIDNEAARICILMGFGKNRTISDMAHVVALAQEDCCCFPWMLECLRRQTLQMLLLGLWTMKCSWPL